MKENIQNPQFDSILNKHLFFKSLSFEDRVLITQNSNLNIYKKRETIVKEGEYVSNLIIVLKGFVMIELQNNKNKMILDILPASSVVGAPLCLTERTYTYSIISLCECEILFIDIQTIRNILLSNARFAFSSIQYFNENFISPLIQKL